LIVGTGAMANLFAARLAPAGIEFSMLGTWTEGLAALQEHGVRLEMNGDRRESYPVRVGTNPAGCAGVKLALVLVKSWQTERAARQVAECLATDGVALTLQNGLGNREILSEVLGPERVALGVTTTGATLLGPARVRPGGEGVISVGKHPRLAPLIDLLQQAGFPVEVHEDIEALLWGKLAINAAINPLTALLGVPNGELLERPPARELSAELAREVAAVARARGIELPYIDPIEAVEEVARRTAANNSSMLQDVRRGAPTEIDAICGAVVREGEALRVPAPVNETMWRLVCALVEGVDRTEKTRIQGEISG
jgi:2-dehydropantoate 2-reductase